MAKVPPFGELIAATTSSAVHLEMRDAYTPDDQRFLDWQAGKLLPEQANPEWSAIVRSHTARGVRFRRVRVVSEPIAPFIRFEYEVTAAVSIAAGEQVRWLPRTRGLDLCLPLNDYWVFDGRLVRFHFFSGTGKIVEDELAEDPGRREAVRPGVRGCMGTRHSARPVPADLTACRPEPMAVSPSSSVQRARQQVAERLREIRLDAGLTARALSVAAGWHEAKTSRIESAKQALTDADIQAWCHLAIRPCFINPRTRLADVDALVDHVTTIGDELTGLQPG